MFTATRSRVEYIDLRARTILPQEIAEKKTSIDLIETLLTINEDAIYREYY